MVDSFGSDDIKKIKNYIDKNNHKPHRL